MAVIAGTGLATFSNLAIDQSGTYTIQATSNGLTSVSTASITVNALAATQLVVTTQPPSSVTAGNGFGVVVTAEDPFGNVATNYTGNIVLALGNNTTGAVLLGTTSQAAVAGVAAFPDLTLTTANPGSDYFLQATSGILSVAMSNPFTVTPAAATQLVWTTEPPASVTTGQSIGGLTGISVAAEDNFGNVVTTFSGSLTAAVAIAAGGQQPQRAARDTSLAARSPRRPSAAWRRSPV